MGVLFAFLVGDLVVYLLVSVMGLLVRLMGAVVKDVMMPSRGSSLVVQLRGCVVH